MASPDLSDGQNLSRRYLDLRVPSFLEQTRTLRGIVSFLFVDSTCQAVSRWLELAGMGRAPPGVDWAQLRTPMLLVDQVV